MIHAHAILWRALSLPASSDGDVEIVVRDLDGKPVANRTARVIEAASFPFQRPDALKPRQIQLDAEGRAADSGGDRDSAVKFPRAGSRLWRDGIL